MSIASSTSWARNRKGRAVLALACTAAFLSGCSGITAAGRKARAEANERFDRMNARFMYDQGSQSLASGQYATALQMGNKLVQMFPDDRSYRILRGRTLMEMNRLESALADFMACAKPTDEGTEDDAESSPAQIAGSATRGAAPNSGGAAATAESGTCARCSYYAGTTFERLGDIERAHEEFAKAAAAEPATLQYSTALAESALALGMLDEAIALVGTLESRFAYSSAVQHLKAEIASMQKDHALASVRLQRVAALIPKELSVQEELLHAEFRQGRWGACLEMLGHPPFDEVALRPDIVRMRARCLLLSGKGIEARDLLLAHPETSGRDGREYWVILGFVAWHVGDDIRLAQSAQMLISIDAGSMEGHLFKWHLAAQSGDVEEARKQLVLARGSEGGPALANRLIAPEAQGAGH